MLTAALIAAIIFFVPPVKGLGDLVKIIFFHVPTAWVSVLAFFVSAIWAAKFLRTGDFSFDELSARSARLGFIFVLMATASGAIFSKLTWGAYLTLRAAVTDEKARAKVSAVYSLLSVLTVPFLVFILPRMYFSLHPTPVINSEGKLDMDTEILIVLIAAVIDATLIFYQLMKMRR